MSKYYLVKLDDNYADEFDVESFVILNEAEYKEGLEQTNKVLDKFFKVTPFTEEQFNKIPSYYKSVYNHSTKTSDFITWEMYKENPQKYVNLHQKEFEMYFGTNEQLMWYSKEDYFRAVKTEEITKEEYDVIHKLFGTSYGTCSYFFPLEGYYDDKE